MAKDDSIFAEERRKMIVDHVNENVKATVPELCDLFSVSSATIRNDLRALEESGLLKRTHGGAISCKSVNYEVNSYERAVERVTQKAQIAAKAVSFIKEGDTIALDTGTTTYELAKLLTKFHDLTVVTNDLQSASFLEQYSRAHIFLAGGRVRRDYHCTYGKKALDSVSDFNVDKAFLGANGISLTRGFTTPNIDTAEVKEAFISIADSTIIITDSTKLDKTSFSKFADFEDVDTIITDGEADMAFVDSLREVGMEVIISSDED